MTKMDCLKSALVVLFACVIPVPANAGPIVVFSGLDAGAGSGDPRPLSNAAAAAFAAAVGGTLVDFEASPLGAFAALIVAPGVTLTGADVGGGSQTIRNSPFGSPDRLFGYNTTTAGAQFASFFGGTMTFTFTTPIEAFGAYFSGLQLDGETITFNDGSPQSVSIPNPGISTGGIAFVGFTDAGASITSVTIDVTGDIVGTDDVRFGSLAVVIPEPATFVLCVGALAGLALLRRRSSRRQN